MALYSAAFTAIASATAAGLILALGSMSPAPPAKPPAITGDAFAKRWHASPMEIRVKTERIIAPRDPEPVEAVTQQAAAPPPARATDPVKTDRRCGPRRQKQWYQRNGWRYWRCRPIARRSAVHAPVRG